MTSKLYVCATCRNSDSRHPREWHHHRHPFRDAGQSMSEAEEAAEQPQVSVSRFPFDPVLRQALIDKGVLTPQDLTDAETKIRTISGQFEEAVRRDGDGGRQQTGPDDQAGVTVLPGDPDDGGVVAQSVGV